MIHNLISINYSHFPNTDINGTLGWMQMLARDNESPLKFHQLLHFFKYQLIQINTHYHRFCCCYYIQRHTMSAVKMIWRLPVSQQNLASSAIMSYTRNFLLSKSKLLCTPWHNHFSMLQILAARVSQISVSPTSWSYSLKALRPPTGYHHIVEGYSCRHIILQV